MSRKKHECLLVQNLRAVLNAEEMENALKILERVPLGFKYRPLQSSLNCEYLLSTLGQEAHEKRFRDYYAWLLTWAF